MGNRVSNVGYNLNRPSLREGDSFPCGGTLIPGIATIAVKVGDVVYFDTTTNQVTKSVTPGNYANKVAGVIVAGRLTNMEPIDDFNSSAAAIAAGINAANAGQEVLIQIDGVCYVVTDSAGTVALGTVGSTFGPSNVNTGAAATAGRVSTNVTAGQIVGNVLQATTANNTAIKAFLMYR